MHLASACVSSLLTLSGWTKPMTDSGEAITKIESSRRLSRAIRDAKNAAADREDVVIEMREAERMRLELLAAELGPVIAEVPADFDYFDFAISNGLQPRFWIDATSHVGMGRDKRTYRFVKDTRLGRVVLAESPDMRTVAEQITRYLAERIIERQRLMEGDITIASAEPAIPQPDTARKDRSGDAPASGTAEIMNPLQHGSPVTDHVDKAAVTSWKPFLTGFGLVVLGAAVGLGTTISYYWDQLDLSRLGLDRWIQ